MPDERAKFIVDKIAEAGRAVKPDATPPKLSADGMKMVEFGLKLFDALLPMLVSHVVAECKKQGATL